jgi:hypothetical protein
MNGSHLKKELSTRASVALYNCDKGDFYSRISIVKKLRMIYTTKPRLTQVRPLQGSDQSVLQGSLVPQLSLLTPQLSNGIEKSQKLQQGSLPPLLQGSFHKLFQGSDPLLPL